uniref:roquin-1-like n=1 Tax=Myxine glutinosa TaxID=7769 RepID=UPI00358FA768
MELLEHGPVALTVDCHRPAVVLKPVRPEHSPSGIEGSEACDLRPFQELDQNHSIAHEQQHRSKEEDPIIPFGEEPTVSKWGAISRSARTGIRNTGPVQATAAQGHATLPVSANDYCMSSHSSTWSWTTYPFEGNATTPPHNKDREHTVSSAPSPQPSQLPATEHEQLRLELELRHVDQQISEQSQLRGLQATPNSMLLQREARALAAQPSPLGRRRGPLGRTRSDVVPFGLTGSCSGRRHNGAVETQSVKRPTGCLVREALKENGEQSEMEGPDDLDITHCLALELTQDDMDGPYELDSPSLAIPDLPFESSTTTTSTARTSTTTTASLPSYSDLGKDTVLVSSASPEPRLLVSTATAIQEAVVATATAKASSLAHLTVPVQVYVTSESGK